ncbi:MAG: PD-(D/E)XK nuclease family protein [Bacteroidetes bacterium]|nr:PD-(D/E)XK nuclease family protein [Bacteroidota bacterium]
MNGAKRTLELEIKDNLTKLKENPLFQLSTGSKELFHSNFLYWVSIKYEKQFAKIFIELSGDKNLGEFDTCRRENKNIDLTLYYKNKMVFIENKIKSLPTPNQLDEYKKKVKKEFPEKGHVFLFLGLHKPLFFEGKKEYESWKYISYKDLVTKIENHFDKKPIYVKHYIDFVKCLSEIGRTFKTIEKDKFDFYDNVILRNLKDLRIHDLYLKKKYQGIGQLLKKELKDKAIWVHTYGLQSILNNEENKCFLNCTYNNGKGTLTLSKVMPTKSKEWIMGIQLEGHQYRQFLAFIGDNITPQKQKEIKETADKFLKPDEKYKWFNLKTTWTQNKLEVKGEGKGKVLGFNKYYTKRKDNQEFFLYKYVKLSEVDGIKVKHVIEAFIKDMNFLEKNSEIIIKQLN